MVHWYRPSSADGEAENSFPQPIAELPSPFDDVSLPGDDYEFSWQYFASVGEGGLNVENIQLLTYDGQVHELATYCAGDDC